MKWSVKIGIMFIACIIMATTFHVAVHAEEVTPEEVTQAPSATVEVSNPTEQAQLEEIIEKLDAILEVQLDAQLQAEAAASEEADMEDEAPVPTADPYLSHLQNIEEQLTDINTNTVPATPETAEIVPAFSVPFNEYSTTEALLLCLFVAGISCIVFAIVKEFT